MLLFNTLGSKKEVRVKSSLRSDFIDLINYISDSIIDKSVFVILGDDEARLAGVIIKKTGSGFRIGSERFDWSEFDNDDDLYDYLDDVIGIIMRR